MSSPEILGFVPELRKPGNMLRSAAAVSIFAELVTAAVPPRTVQAADIMPQQDRIMQVIDDELVRPKTELPQIGLISQKEQGPTPTSVAEQVAGPTETAQEALVQGEPTFDEMVIKESETNPAVDPYAASGLQEMRQLDPNVKSVIAIGNGESGDYYQWTLQTESVDKKTKETGLEWAQDQFGKWMDYPVYLKTNEDTQTVDVLTSVKIGGETKQIQYSVLPDSKGASIVFRQGKSTIPVKTPIDVGNNQKAYAEYFDRDANLWKVDNEVAVHVVGIPEGFSTVKAAQDAGYHLEVTADKISWIKGETVSLTDIWSPTQKLTEAQKKFVTEDPKAIQERQDLLAYRDYLKKATPKSQQETFGKSGAEGLKLELITDVDDPNVGKQVLVSPDMKDFVFIPMNDNWKNLEAANNAVGGIQLVEAENYAKIIRKTNNTMLKNGFIPLNSELSAKGDELVFVKGGKVVADYISQYDRIWPVFNQNAEGQVAFDVDGKIWGKLYETYTLSYEEAQNAVLAPPLFDGVDLEPDFRPKMPKMTPDEKVIVVKFTTNEVNMRPFARSHGILVSSNDPSILKMNLSDPKFFNSNDENTKGYIGYAIPVPKDLDVKRIAVKGADGTAVGIWDASQSKPEVTR